ncbi:MAG: prepilin-type N-terminal cleavage/methylation domain-containing protein [Terriglobales bacterium]
MMKQGTKIQSRKRNQEQGFSLLETLFATVILMIGLLAMLATFAYALATTHSVQEDQIAKQTAQDALENIFTARDTQQITFAQIANVAGGGIFMDGFTNLLDTGPDGLAGTADDIAFSAGSTGCPSAINPYGVQCIRLPGSDGLLGTADDTFLVLSNFQRQITIANTLNPDGTPNVNLKQIAVTVRYTKLGFRVPRTYTVNSLISVYR